MKYDSVFHHFIEQAETPFTGWDFSYVHGTGRIGTEALPWSYASMAIPLLAQADSMLDMGTGGGEFISKMVPLPPLACATEAYEPNVPIAIDKLDPLGVKVFAIQNDSELPFPDKQFSLILNRHEAFDAKEVRRILKDGGIFFTQQVGGQDCQELNKMLGITSDEYSEWNVTNAVKQLEEAGLSIQEKGAYTPYQRFYDIGALIYYVKTIPWQFPAFSCEQYLDELYLLHLQIQENGYIEVKSDRFFVLAVAP